MTDLHSLDMSNSIRHLKRKDIDTVRWDSCVRNDPAGTIYAHAACLDHLAVDWDALVLGDHEAVLPLPRKRKFGIDYIYPPRFTGAFGIYGHLPPGMTATGFLAEIPERFRLWDMHLSLPGAQVPWPHRLRRNHLLRLEGSYEALKSRFRPACRQLVHRAGERGLQVRPRIAAEDVIDRAAAKGSMSGTTAEDRRRLHRLYEYLSDRDMAFTRGVHDERGELLASALFFRCERRIYYIAAWSGEKGRLEGAAHLLLAELIREHAGSGLVLDFEGSDIPGIAFFFENFGAVPEEYFFIRHNRLPWWLRNFKADIV
jgi:hypothetical protein